MTDHLLPASADERYRTIPLVKRLLSEQGAQHWKKYLVAFALMAIVAACTASSAYLIGQIVNETYLYRNLHGVIWVSVAIFAVFTIKGLAAYGQSVTLARIANGIIASNQQRVFAKLLKENLGFFADRHSTEFVARLTNGANATGQVLNLLITAIGRDIFSLIALAIVMVWQDPIMSVFGLLIAPPAMFFLRTMIRRIYAIARAQFHGGAQIIETLQESLQGIRIVKSFALENTMRERFNKHVAAVEHESNKIARVGQRSSPLMETLGGIAIAIGCLYGGYRVIVLGNTPGEFAAFITAFLLAYEPAKRLARFNIELNNGLVGVRALLEILDSPPSEPDDDDKPALKIERGGIEFSGVSFAYRLKESVLRDLSFAAEPGQMTALVGPSGGGKSTVFNLLLRFYDAESGTIKIGGTDITSVSRHSLRQNIGYVGQDVFLFRGTIGENIGLGRPDARESDVIAAAKGAYAHDFIMSFPAGYDTPVGEHGLQLSGGQRQRIAIARALIKDAPIVLLDEATAALDSESEMLVREAMNHLCEGKTTLAIAHRLHTVSHAHRILVVEDGRIVEAGRHDELLRKNGRYAIYYRLQLQGQETRPQSVMRA